MTMITPSYLGETIEYSSLHACRSTLEDPTRKQPRNMTLRSAPNTYEVRIRDGAPRSATRLTADGAVLHGAAAMASLLGERAGRFTVNPERAPIDPDLTGSLHQQIAACVARSRGVASIPRIVAAPVSPPPASPPPATAPLPVRVVPVLDIPIDVGPEEPPARTLPLAPRVFVPRTVTVTPRAILERTLPLARPVTHSVTPPSPAPFHLPAPLPFAPSGPRARRSWGGSLRWVGVAAVAALGLVLGAGVRALRQTPAPTPPVAAAAVPLR